MLEMYLNHIPKQVSSKQCFIDHSSQMKHTLLNHCQDEAWIRYGSRELSFVHGWTLSLVATNKRYGLSLVL